MLMFEEKYKDQSVKRAKEQARIRDTDGDGIPDFMDVNPTISEYKYLRLSSDEYNKVKDNDYIRNNCRKTNDNDYVYRYQTEEQLRLVQDNLRRNNVVTRIPK